jgi:hypothetical protein
MVRLFVLVLCVNTAACRDKAPPTSVDRAPAEVAATCAETCEAQSACSVGTCSNGSCEYRAQKEGTECSDAPTDPCFQAQCTGTGRCNGRASLRSLPIETCSDSAACCSKENWEAAFTLRARALLTRWQDAQEAKDFPHFASMYSPTVQGVKFADRKSLARSPSTFRGESWLVDRALRFERRQLVAVHSITVESVQPRQLRVFFVEEWASGNKLIVSRKQLTIGVDLLIYEEIQLSKKILSKACSFRGCSSGDSSSIEERVQACQSGCAAGSALECFALAQVMTQGECGQDIDMKAAGKAIVKVCEAQGLRGCAEGGEYLEHYKPQLVRGFYRQACDNGQPYACEQLVRVLGDGIGGEIDLASTVPVLEGLCERMCQWPGAELSCVKVAAIYRQGKIVEVDPARAKYFASRSEEACYR